MSERFAGKVCLVTGASSGIGRATAIAFGQQGASVIVADMNAQAGEEVAAEIKRNGSDAIFVPVNISQLKDVEHMVSVAVSRFGRLDCAVNNAAISGSVTLPTNEYPEDEWNRVIAVNLTGTWYCVKQVLDQMLKQGCGTIVNVSSAAGLRGHSGNVSYAAAKHGVVGLTKTAALECATKNIRVNAVCPTGIETPMMLDGRRNLRNDPKAYEDAANYQAMKRLGKPQEVADVILWLSSEESTFITGHAMAIDGGAFA
ncbi:SDR family NAD(P)-dependent oxidoreductase [Paenibacillus periandrae]|uniref:SDR family NAD(P)-dependent oxidoreductase n=1 Tax=Paenibacillus periandrae TaxID=1761741 RepID=UPI001F08A746|nr:glucose 1-dehydrogenase [Paenibacillus periandrae]